MRRAGERGAIVPFIVVITAALLMLLGLVVDGGRILSHREHAIETAQEASRAGAEQLNLATLHGSGPVGVEAIAAQTAAQIYLHDAGETGVVAVSGDTVTVTVTGSVTMQILQLVGITNVPISESQTAHAQRGVP